MTRAQQQPTQQDNDQFIDDMLAFGDGRWVCHEELKDIYDGWIIANLDRNRGSSSRHRATLHAQILSRGGVQNRVRGYSDYVDGRQERLHFLGVGLHGQIGTSLWLRD